MAKLSNVGNQQHQEDYPLVASFFGTVGVLACLIVTVMGIKLWWFKHRLNFEQTSLHNGAAGGQTPNVVVTRREKKSTFSKDKRWSQQIYQSVEVHGVFKQKTEDDMEIQRPQQLPPVRIRHAESAPSLILPPPRLKRSQERVQSTAFDESGEIYETITPSSNHSQEIVSRPTSLAVSDSDTRISLTFEEFENQLKLPHEETATQNIAVKTPQPPKRPNRSNSTLQKAEGLEEKPHRFLKSSQSIGVPEYRKVMERRPTGFQRPTEDDLTKIDNFEEPRFEKFGDRRPTGYIKYEEVDFHLNEIRNDYRQSTEYDEGNSMYDSGYLDNQSNDTAIEALRNEEVLYQNNAKETLEFNKPNISHGSSPLYANSNELALEYNDISTTTSFEYSSVQKDNELVNINQSETRFEPTKTNLETSFTTHETWDDLSPLDHMEFKTKEVPTLSPGNMEPQAFAFCDEMEQDIYSEPQSETSIFQNFSKNSEFEKDYFENPDNLKHAATVDYESIDVKRHTKAESNETHEEYGSKTVSFYGQAIETANFEEFSSNQTRVTEFVRDSQSKENCKIAEVSETQIMNHQKASPGVDRRIQPHVNFLLNENTNGFDLEDEEKFTLNQRRRPTEFARFKVLKEDEPAKPLHQSVTFFEDLTFPHGDEEKFTLNQRRPTEFSRFKFENVENDHEFAEKQTVRFEFNQIDDKEDKFTLNQRRPTAFVSTTDIKEDLYEEIRVQEVKFEDLYEEIQTPPATPSTQENFKETQRTESKSINLLENDTIYKASEPKTEIDRPIAFVRRTKSTNSDKGSNTCIWQELERDIQLDFTQNIEEEFDKIRHSFEMNEADFLEIKGELQLNSPMSDTLPYNTMAETSSSAFGKSIEDDWENFEKLKSDTKENCYELVQGHKEIHITFDNEIGNGKGKENEMSTVSILKESKLEQILDESSQLEAKPRKSKVTFDFKTEEYVIPARKSPSDEDTEDDGDDYDGGGDFDWDEQDYAEDVYNKPPPPIPTQRLTIPKSTEKHDFSPVLTKPSAISLFGSQISQDDSGETEDSWSAIRKHRHLTSQFQNLSLDSPTSPPPPSFPPPPLPTSRNLDSTKDRAPRPAYRNPMAQLAVQRAKEVRTEMGGFKSRSIKDSKQAQAKRTSPEFLQLKNDFADTDA